MHYAVARIFSDAGVLHKLYTDCYAGKVPMSLLRSVPSTLLPAAFRRLAQRIEPAIPNRLVQAHNALGLLYANERLRAHNEEAAMGVHLKYGAALNRASIRSGALDANIVWGYNSASLEIFRAAKRSGQHTILEQTIAPRELEQAILQEAGKRYPHWSIDDPDVRGRNWTAFVNTEREEWSLANLILCGSSFVKQSIISCGGPEHKCVVVPYGVKLASASTQICAVRDRKTKLKVLFVGAVNLRKGAPIVHEISARTSAIADWRVVGPIQVPANALGWIKRNAEVYGPVTKSEVRTQLEWADVLVLPSLCEGSATVTYEALAMGVPVVCSQSAGSIVEHRSCGFVVTDPLDVSAYVNALSELHDDRDLLAEYSEKALARASYGSLEAYACRLLATVGLKRASV